MPRGRKAEEKALSEYNRDYPFHLEFFASGKWCFCRGCKTADDAKDLAVEFSRKDRIPLNTFRVRDIRNGESFLMVEKQEFKRREMQTVSEASVVITFDDGHTHKFGPIGQNEAQLLYNIIIRNNPGSKWGVRQIVLSTSSTATVTP